MTQSANLPAEPGTYVLLMRLAEPCRLTVGRLGTFELAAGWYAYVGSAHGPGGLTARVGRHLRRDKKPHWHVDALTAAAPVQAVWLRASGERLECIWARRLAALQGVHTPVPGLGASDCRCRTHLFRIPVETQGAAWEALGRPVRFATGARNAAPPTPR